MRQVAHELLSGVDSDEATHAVNDRNCVVKYKSAVALWKRVHVDWRGQVDGSLVGVGGKDGLQNEARDHFKLFGI